MVVLGTFGPEDRGERLSCTLTKVNFPGLQAPAGRYRGDVMKSTISVGAIVVSLAFSTTSAYAGRVANTAIGTIAGLVVFGPVGAVAGAAVGYTAGHGIARSWGLSQPRRTSSRYVQRKADSAVSYVPVPRSKPSDSGPVERRAY